MFDVSDLIFLGCTLLIITRDYRILLFFMQNTIQYCVQIGVLELEFFELQFVGQDFRTGQIDRNPLSSTLMKILTLAFKLESLTRSAH